MIILGINAYHGDLAACLVVNGKMKRQRLEGGGLRREVGKQDAGAGGEGDRGAIKVDSERLY